MHKKVYANEPEYTNDLITYSSKGIFGVIKS